MKENTVRQLSKIHNSYIPIMDEFYKAIGINGMNRYLKNTAIGKAKLCNNVGVELYKNHGIYKIYEKVRTKRYNDVCIELYNHCIERKLDKGWGTNNIPDYLYYFSGMENKYNRFHVYKINMKDINKVSNILIKNKELKSFIDNFNTLNFGCVTKIQITYNNQIINLSILKNQSFSTNKSWYSYSVIIPISVLENVFNVKVKKYIYNKM